MKKIIYFSLICFMLFPITAFAAFNAKIGDQTYTNSVTLAAALQDGDTVVYTGNSEDITVSADVKNITFDLNGYEVTAIILSGNSSGMKIIDSSTGKTGKITSSIQVGAGSVSSNPNAVTELTVEGIKIDGKVNVRVHGNVILKNLTADGVKGTGVEFLNNSGIATIKSGTYNGQITNSGTLTIEGGTFTKFMLTNLSLEGAKAEATIKGGTFDADTNEYVISAGSGSATTNIVTVEDGTFTGKRFVLSDGAFTMKKGTVTVTGTIFSGKGTININGGTYTTTTTGTAISCSEGTINFNSGKIVANKAGTDNPPKYSGVYYKVFNFGVKTAEPKSDDPILELRKGTVLVIDNTLNFYAGTMYLLTDNISGYRSVVNLYDVTSEKQTDGSYKLWLKSSKATTTTDKDTTPKYSCKKVDGKFYDKNGNEVTKEAYENSCKEPVPDTGVIIPIVIIGLLTGGAIILRRRNNALTRI